MRQGQKSKKRNVKGRKPPQFSQMVLTILKDATVTVEEMMEASPTKTLNEETGRIVARYDTLPEDCTTIDSLNGTWAFKDERLFRHIEMIARAQNEFSNEFYNPDGLSVLALRYDKKGRTWGDEIAVCGLAYLMIVAGLAEWTQPRNEWQNNEDKMPRIRFIKQNDTLGDSDEQTYTQQTTKHIEDTTPNHSNR